MKRKIALTAKQWSMPTTLFPNSSGNWKCWLLGLPPTSWLHSHCVNDKSDQHDPSDYFYFPWINRINEYTLLLGHSGTQKAQHKEYSQYCCNNHVRCQMGTRIIRVSLPKVCKCLISQLCTRNYYKDQFKKISIYSSTKLLLIVLVSSFYFTNKYFFYLLSTISKLPLLPWEALGLPCCAMGTVGQEKAFGS